ncbi:hypothetical protein F511_26088 [Dorcoceras hygrometricum]|uniref:Uncharacterized protein n=1 Tax=Dorcoceras hygrometricum TaxID=472368 RepID=A0A2Z7CIX6_9LAMI|nr:hypothetical protein F511_26088 [Dorcoceras hygrometricum]
MGCPGQARTIPRRKISRRIAAGRHAGRRPHGGGRRHIARGARSAQPPREAAAIMRETSSSGRPPPCNVDRQIAQPATTYEEIEDRALMAEQDELKIEKEIQHGDNNL